MRLARLRNDEREMESSPWFELTQTAPVWAKPWSVSSKSKAPLRLCSTEKWLLRKRTQRPFSGTLAESSIRPW